jgi:hypothetical protein
MKDKTYILTKEQVLAINDSVYSNYYRARERAKKYNDSYWDESLDKAKLALDAMDKNSHKLYDVWA